MLHTWTIDKHEAKNRIVVNTMRRSFTLFKTMARARRLDLGAEKTSPMQVPQSAPASQEAHQGPTGNVISTSCDWNERFEEGNQPAERIEGKESCFRWSLDAHVFTQWDA